MKNIGFVFCVLFFSITKANAFVDLSSDSIITHRFSEEQCVDYAIAHLADLKNAKIDVRIQEAQNREYLGMALPQVGLKGSTQRFIDIPQMYFPDVFSPVISGILHDKGVKDGSGNVIQQSSPGPGSLVAFGQNWNASMGATISQILFEPNVFISLIAAKELMKFANATYAVSEEKVRENVYKLYYSYLTLQKRLKLLEDNVKTIQRLLYETEESYKSGLREKLDVDRTKVALYNLTTVHNQLTIAVQNLYAMFKFSIGIKLKDSLVLSNTLNEGMAIIKLENINDFDYTQRKDFKLLSVSKALREIDVKRNRLLFAPTVVLAYDFSYNSIAGELGQLYGKVENVSNAYKSSLINLSLNIPLLKGNSQRNKLKQAQLQLEKINNTIENSKTGIDIEIQTNQRNYSIELENLNYQKDNVGLAISVYETTKKKYDEGLSMSFELIDAANQMSLAEDKYYQSLLQVINAKISLQKSLGRLSSN